MLHSKSTVLTLLVLAAGTFSQFATALERSNIDVQHYALEFSLSLDGDYVFQNALSGTAKIRFQNAGVEAIKDIPVLLNRLMRYETVTDEAGRNLEIQSRLLELDNFEFYQANTAVVTLVDPLEPGETMELSIAFDGRLVGYVEAGMLYTQENLDPEFTILRSEVLAWPQIADPDWLEVRRGWADPFEWTAEFDVPATHRVANGEPVEVISLGERSRFSYRSTRPDTYLVFPVAPYTEVRAGANRIFHLPGSEAGAKRIADGMVKAMPLFESWLGPLAQEGGLSIIEIPEGFGSQSGFPTIIQSADAFNSADEISQLYHELSHLWNVDDYEPQSPRLEEGLATFLEALVDVKLGGTTDLSAYMAGISNRLVGTYERNSRFRDFAIADFGREGVTGLSYGVGALFYYDLYKSLGEDEFIALLRGYYDAYRKGGGNFNAMLAYYREHAGAESAKLVDEWLVGTGYVAKLKVE